MVKNRRKFFSLRYFWFELGDRLQASSVDVIYHLVALLEACFECTVVREFQWIVWHVLRLRYMAATLPSVIERPFSGKRLPPNLF